MSSTTTHPAPWPRRTWLNVIGSIFLLQLVLIFVLSDRSPVRARSAQNKPIFRLASPRSLELLALEDPTWFALPHPQGFSGPIWMVIPPFTNRFFSWSEQPHSVTLNIRDLGAAFAMFAATNYPGSLPTPPPPEPLLQLPKLTLQTMISTSSQLRIEGDLARRQLLTPVSLPSFPAAELLTNTILELTIDAEGRPISKAALLASCGNLEADQNAVEQARLLRFAPAQTASADQANNPFQTLTWGKLVFEWHTLPLPAQPAKP